ncbi:MAG TPA: endolytic transglycosylase MltG [Rhodanobacteraceae bacterium]
MRILIGVLVALVVAAVAWGAIAYVHFQRTPLAVRSTGQTLEIARGEGLPQIVAGLRSSGLTRAPSLFWRILATRLKVANKLRAGEYALAPGMTPAVLLDNMAAGRVLHRRVTLVDGWTFAQVRKALAAAPKLRDDLRGLGGTEIMARLGAAGRSPEGEFLPDTYDYVLGMSDLDVLRRAHKAMQAFMAQAWAKRSPGLWMTQPYQALILASLVEKESAVPSELPRIAGVFERRLKIGMKLDTDPSVIYGMGASYKGKIHASDLTADTPYNTYVHGGLPPTPISLPSRAAILAVLHPAAGDAMYFVAKGNGTHKFSATLAEQNAAVRKYILDKKHP